MQGPTKYTNKIHLVILVLALLPLGSLAFSNFFAMKRVTSAELDKHDSIVLQPIPSASLCALESEDRGARVFRYMEDSLTCNITLYSSKFTFFWYYPRQGKYTEVFTQWHYWSPSKLFFLTEQSVSYVLLQLTIRFSKLVMTRKDTWHSFIEHTKVHPHPSGKIQLLYLIKALWWISSVRGIPLIVFIWALMLDNSNWS